MNNKIILDVYVKVKHSNPNGDPAAGNMPRTNPVNGKGLMTSNSIKRKIRDTVSILSESMPECKNRYGIFIKKDSLLSEMVKDAYPQEFIEEVSNVLKAKNKKGKKAKDEDIESDEESSSDCSTSIYEKKAVKYICDRYFDVRTFGQALSAISDKEIFNNKLLDGKSIGFLQGPVQITMAESVDPVDISEIKITRCARNSKKESVNEEGETKEKANRNFGSKFVVHDAVYNFQVYVNPYQAKYTGFDWSDLNIMIKAIITMFDYTRSDGRAGMAIDLDKSTFLIPEENISIGLVEALEYTQIKI